MEVTFWYEQVERVIIVIHNPSGERREIRKIKKIKEFLQAYGITLEDCKDTQYEDDCLHLFKKMKVRK